MIKKRTSRFVFPTAREFVRAYTEQDENKYTDDPHYFRGGSPSLARLEKHISTLVGVEDGYLALTNSGMSAVITALEIAALTAGDIVVHGIEEYGGIYKYITIDLVDRGIIPIEVDAGNTVEIERTLQKLTKQYGKEKIKVIFLETVGNGPSMPVLDIEKFLSFPILEQINPLVIIDNTLPTNSILPLATYIKSSKHKIIGLESATKFYLMNQDLGGILFTYDEHILSQLLNKRMRIGTTPGPSLIKAFNKLIVKTKTQFDKENKIFMRNTKLLARACAKAAEINKKFNIGHPNLSDHPNYNYAKTKFSDGASPVFFITLVETSETKAEKFFYRLAKEGAFKDILFTESFGFDKTGVMHSSRYGGYIRIAGGLETENETIKLARRLSQALSKL